MAGASNIEWTEQTWNPIIGCTIVSPGCTNCYAMAMAHRINKMTLSSHYEGTTKKVNGKAVWTGKLSCAPDFIFTAPLRRRKPTTYFVNSMGDLFHEDCPDDWIDRVFAVMALSPQHTFQVLTKRAERMQAYFDEQPTSYDTAAARLDAACGKWLSQSDFDRLLDPSFARPLPNVWLGVSAERQQEWDERTEHLRNTPAALTFVSAEPLLGPIRAAPCRHCNHPGNIIEWPCSACKGRRFELPDWVIVGGESGPSARPMQVEWVDDLVAQCRAADVACFVKQLGATPVSDGYPLHLKSAKGGEPSEWPDRLRVREMPSVSLSSLPSALAATSNKSSDEVSA